MARASGMIRLLLFVMLQAGAEALALHTITGSAGKMEAAHSRHICDGSGSPGGAAACHVNYSSPTALVQLQAEESRHAAPVWGGSTPADLRNEYQNIFKTGNRNAASHLWTNFLLERSSGMTEADLLSTFKGFCPISGSPVSPQKFNKYKVTLKKADGTGNSVGYLHHCCWPCLCDTKDLVQIDTKEVRTKDQGMKKYQFAVIGNPCKSPEKLQKGFSSGFRGETTLAQAAPEVQCDNGILRSAQLSDNGHPIIGMLFNFLDKPQIVQEMPKRVGGEKVPGRMWDFYGEEAQDEDDLEIQCRGRAQRGYDSGMGKIFREVASITTIAPGK